MGTDAHESGEFVDMLAALAEPTRLEIVKLLASEGEQSIKQICAAVGLSASRASFHLSKLESADLISIRKDGLYRRVTLRPPEHLALQLLNLANQVWTGTLGA